MQLAGRRRHYVDCLGRPDHSRGAVLGLVELPGSRGVFGMAQSRNSIKVVSVLGRVSFVRPCRRVRVEMSSAEREKRGRVGNGGMECSPDWLRYIGVQSSRYLALHTASLGAHVPGRSTRCTIRDATTCRQGEEKSRRAEPHRRARSVDRPLGSSYWASSPPGRPKVGTCEQSRGIILKEA